MDSDQKERERIAHGRLAKAYLADENLMGFFDRHKAILREIMFETGVEDTKRREDLYHMYHGIDEVLLHMQAEANYVDAADALVKAEQERLKK